MLSRSASTLGATTSVICNIPFDHYISIRFVKKYCIHIREIQRRVDVDVKLAQSCVCSVDEHCSDEEIDGKSHLPLTCACNSVVQWIGVMQRAV